MCAEVLPKRTSHVSGENEHGPSVPAQGHGRASRRQLLAQTYGLQAKGWHGPVSFGKIGGCAGKDQARGERVGDGRPWVQRLVFG